MWKNKSTKKKTLTKKNINTDSYHVPLSFRVFSSVISGIITAFTTLPLEVTKTRMQVQLNKNPHKNFKGTFDAMFRIAKNEGITSLYRGLNPTLIQILPASAM
jgi:hypothetical protein